MLEGAEAATSFATGMAAISNTLFTLLSPGDRVVSVKDTYGGTNKLFLEFLPRFGIEVELCDTTDHDRSRPRSREGCTLALPGDARPTRRSRWSTSRGSPAAAHAVGRTGGRRQHLRHADQPEPAGARRRPGAPQRDQVPRRSRRRAGRRGVRRARAGRAGLPLPRDHRRDARPDGGLPAPARHEDAAPAHRPAERERPAIARWLEAQPAVAARLLPGPRDAPAARHRRRQMRGFGGVLSFDARGRLRGGARVLPRLRSPTSRPTWARSRRSPARRPPPATSNARPRSATRWASPRG